MRYQKILIGLLVAINLGFVVYFFAGRQKEDIVYVDLLELFDGFDFKKERQQQYDIQRKTYQSRLDSLKLNYSSYSQSLHSDPGNQRLQQAAQYSAEIYLQSEAYYNHVLDSLDGRFNEEVWGKINTLVEEYGKTHDHDIIIGASGSGSVMYGKEAHNITADVLEYINNKYNGKEK